MTQRNERWTPRPWKAEIGGCIKTTNLDAGIQLKNGLDLPQIACVVGLHEDRPKGEREANCRLVAAAPGLYEALTRVPEAIRMEGIDFREVATNDWVFTQSALRKARGEEKGE